MSRLQKIFWYSLVVKLIVAAVLPLTADESYYWVWSHHHQLSYFDHPPFVAWLFWLGHPLENVLSLVRWPAVLLSHGTLAIWLRVFRRWLSPQQLELWLWLALLSPLLGGSAMVITPDVPLLFFWSLSALFFLRWTQRPTWLHSLFLGLAFGFGMTSKYVMVLFLLSLLPVLVLAPSLRRLFLRTFPWLALGAILGFLPVLIWNAQNDFVSFQFQLSHGLGRPTWKPSWTYEYVIVQLALIFPIVFYLACRGVRRSPPLWTFLSFVPLVFFFITSYRGYVEANWPIVAYPSLFFLAVLGSHGRERLLQFTASLWALLVICLFALILVGDRLNLPETKLREFSRYDSLAAKTEDLRPLYARSYQMAASLTYHHRRPVYKLRGMNRTDFYDFIPESVPLEYEAFVAVEKGDRPPDILKQQSLEIVEVIPVDSQFEIWRLVKR